MRVPVGCDDVLPQGVQLIGARFREDLVLDAAQTIEDRPPTLTRIQPRSVPQPLAPIQFHSRALPPHWRAPTVPIAMQQCYAVNAQNW